MVRRTVRFSDELAAWLLNRANKNGRTVQGEILYILGRIYEGEQAITMLQQRGNEEQEHESENNMPSMQSAEEQIAV